MSCENLFYYSLAKNKEFISPFNSIDIYISTGMFFFTPSLRCPLVILLAVLEVKPVKPNFLSNFLSLCTCLLLVNHPFLIHLLSCSFYFFFFLFLKSRLTGRDGRRRRHWSCLLAVPADTQEEEGT